MKSRYQFRHYYYGYYKKDASEPVDTSIQLDMQRVAVTGIELSPDGRKVSLSLETLKPGYIYELKLNDIRSSDGVILENNLICYTLNNLVGASTTAK